MAAERREHWQSLPGRWDSLNASHLFPTTNVLGIPQLAHTPVSATPAWLVPYRTRIRSTRELEGAVHFFLEDYRFETVWYRPRKALAALQGYQTVLTPDFSLYRDWPLVLQQWNTYRNRWCGAFWQSHGFTVIPTVSWSTRASYEFCFLGIPPRSVVALSTVGIAWTDPVEHRLFLDGFREMVNRLQPSRVLCYGPASRTMEALVEIVTYPTRWEGIRRARAQRAQAVA
jgi:hypothetical protein